VGHISRGPTKHCNDATGVLTYLVEGEHGVVDLPVLHVNLSMGCVRHTIDTDLELLGTLLSSLRTNLFFSGQSLFSANGAEV